MANDPYTISHRWFDEVWNRGHEEAIDELLAIDVIGHNLGEGEVRGPAAFRVFWRNMRSAFPDLHIRIEDTIVQGPKAAVRVVLEGTHRGEGLGLPPTGRRVTVGGNLILKVEGGKVVEAWNAWDQLGLLRQLGVVPAAPGGDRFLSAHA